MSARTPFSTFALAAVAALALALAGCGDSNDSPTATPAGATQSVVPPVTGGSGSTKDVSGNAKNSLAQAYQSCLIAANGIQDASRRRSAAKQCEQIKSTADKAVDRGDDALKNLRKQCQDATKNAPNEAVRKTLEENCKKLPQ
ncbi:MAG: hypothetical protein ACRDKI_04375 [Solirubrobacterales bacterium]